MSKSQFELVNQSISRSKLGMHAMGNNGITIKPFITISRDPGSGGKPIAQLVAKKLKFDFYDRELIDAIAKSSKRRRQIINNIDERTRTAIQDLVHNLFNPEYISDLTYINHLTNVVLSLTHKGRAVILGRGANFITPRNKGLSVLITAPKAVRIQRAVEYEKINSHEAIKRIEKYSLERREFVYQYFHKKYLNPNYYDLILNTHYFSIHQAAEIIVCAFLGKFPEHK